MYKRVALHHAGLRKDEVSVALARGTGVCPDWLLLFIVRVIQLIETLSGYPIMVYPPRGIQSIKDYFALRTYFIDSKLEIAMKTVSQMCILGAGYDVRCSTAASELHSTRSNLKLFEVEKPDTQLAKRKALVAGGVDSKGVSFVPVDFMKERLFTKLKENGYDTSEPSVFVLEGLLCYLSDSAIKDTLTEISVNSPRGTIILFDYVALPYTQNYTFGKFLKHCLKCFNEPFLSGVPATTNTSDGVPGCRDCDVSAWLKKFGFELVEHNTAAPFGGVALAKVAKGGGLSFGWWLLSLCL
eukprot:GHVR01045639.1.p1 GENE.GHVR01045639.1~~GHVR01045639.1.p1  ORF type:complete len:298 (+),score=63.28 GHVR01045639.1:59-952(+)